MSYIVSVGFKQVRGEAVRALEEGRVQHEARDDVDEKNLLLTGEVTSAQVVHLLKACRGIHYSCMPHHVVREIDVHIFKPKARIEPKGDRKYWYIKLYFLDPDVGSSACMKARRSSGDKTLQSR